MQQFGGHNGDKVKWRKRFQDIQDCARIYEECAFQECSSLFLMMIELFLI